MPNAGIIILIIVLKVEDLSILKSIIKIVSLLNIEFYERF